MLPHRSYTTSGGTIRRRRQRHATTSCERADLLVLPASVCGAEKTVSSVPNCTIMAQVHHLPFKPFKTAAITIIGIELLLRTSKGQFPLSSLTYVGSQAALDAVVHIRESSSVAIEPQTPAHRRINRSPVSVSKAPSLG
jgi:hypothetical protein